MSDCKKNLGRERSHEMGVEQGGEGGGKKPLKV